MYDDLIKRLREIHPEEFGDAWDFAFACQQAMHEAADVIEELSAYVRQIEELRKDGYYLQKTKMMTYGQTTMTMPLPEPPEEE